MNPTFSLIAGTICREQELIRFLDSLRLQTRQDFELILVDQNPPGMLDDILSEYAESFPLIYLRSEPGLSRARNLGLEHAQGQIIAFPDDDCWYPPELLEQVHTILSAHPEWDGITGVANGGTGGASQWKWDPRPGPIDLRSVWQQAISITVFLRRVVTETVGIFDVSLGVGSGTPWGSGEETDYLIRAIQRGRKIFFCPDLVVFHEDQIPDYGLAARAQAYRYACGMGRVLRKHRYPVDFLFSVYGKPFLNTFRHLLLGRKSKGRYFWAIFLGRLKGLI